jgi:hypothetical protein
MSEVIPFPTITADMRPGFVGSAVVKEITRSEYLKAAKETLTENDYKMILLAILDEEYYNSYDELIRKAVNDYYDLGV